MKDLQVSFHFKPNIITHYTHENDPVYGDALDVEVNGQVFRKVFHAKSLSLSVERLNRERARLLGRALKEIGDEIKRQALHGKSQELTINGQKVIYF